jgi:Domain of unknown function (DUF1707)
MESHEPLYHWTAKGSIDSVLGVSEIGGEHTLAQVKEMLGLHLTDLEVRYPGSKDHINLARQSLGRTNGYSWHQRVELWTGVTYRTLTLSVQQSVANRGVPGATAPAVARRRAGDADRERYLAHLSSAFQGGFLQPDEFTRRSDAVHDCVYADELPPLIADLDPLPPPEAVVALPQRKAVTPTRAEKLRLAGLVAVAMAFAFTLGGILLGPVGSGMITYVAPAFLIVGMLLALWNRGGKRP